jgi:plasmid stabilization system protein ParE
MNPRAQIRPQARDDLYEQFLYLSHRGDQVAWRFLEAFESTVDRLVELPDLGIKYGAGQDSTEEIRV